MIPQATARESGAWGWAVAAVAALVAAVSAHPYAGGWNDGSRLATAECLVDHHTWAIDESVFVRPAAADPGAPPPYRADDAALESLLLSQGTLDKMFIDGHYYSDKSPAPALWLAGAGAAFEAVTGWTARTRPDAFCYALTLASSGLAYVLAVWSVWRLGRPVGLPRPWRLLLTAGFGLTTLAVPYLRHVNNHILLLGVVAAMLAEMAWIARGAVTRPRLLRLGLLAGLSYVIDVGTGPILLGGAALWLAWRLRPTKSRMTERRNDETGMANEIRSSFPVPRSVVLSFLGSCALFLLAAAPWVVLHHALNYMIGGTLGPANANPAYFAWPGCPFNAQTMTGVWHHANVLAFVLYALDLLIGKQGFLGHNLALGLAVAGCMRLGLCRRPSPDRPEAVLAVGWCVATWLLYSVTSTNHSGVCCSVRWFVPLLAPGYYILAIWLRDCPPAHRRDFLILSAWGLVLAALMWRVGPWTEHRVPGFWAIQVGSLTSVLTSVYFRWRERPAELAAAAAAERRAA